MRWGALLVLLPTLASAQWIQQGAQVQQGGTPQGYAKQINCLPPLLCSTDGFTATVDATQAMPTGSVQMYAGASAPAGWLLCDGSSVLRAQYPALFAAIGTTFGSVDGSHFTLPDLRGRVAVGTGAGSGLTNRVLAATGGEEAHAQTVSELATHNHVDSGHTHKTATRSGDTTTDTAAVARFMSGGPVDSFTQAIDTYSFSGSANIQNAGSGTPANVMQPFVVLSYIIKT